MKYMAMLITLLYVTGCGGASQQYLLSVPGSSVRASSGHHAQIGVDKVGVPAYLSGNKIPIQSTEGQLTYCDSAVWASAPEKGLTEHAIAYLQKRFATPHVYRYPWDIERKNGVRLKIAITRFVYVEAEGSVVLEASYFVEPLQGQRRAAKLFKTHVAVSKGETPLIVAAMNQAFDQLVEQAARLIGRF